MKKLSRVQVAQEAAKFMLDGAENEYLHAKERATIKLGISGHNHFPSNKTVKGMISLLAKVELGEGEIKKRVRRMREIALEIMLIIEDNDPFLIGSTLSGKIRATSDIDLHAYADDPTEIQEKLELCGFTDIELEEIENLKGYFMHLKWEEEGFPVEITVYPWKNRDVKPISSVTGKLMKRADVKALNKILALEQKKK
ncbi:MAG: hypothetical protein SFY67_18575 [Candidatus Melainabacteria bacterium]|nr:hypothetical protein [Candidatus Melainabacteria bacterium]